MQLIRAASRATSVALLYFPIHISAQWNSSWNQNITLRFFTTSQEDSCNYTTSASALTFTTESIPIQWHCFDFASLFGGNATQGFENQTRFQPGVWGEAGIHWRLDNTASYDPSANYSSILYRQHVTRPNDDRYEVGHYADRRVTLYGAKGCTQKNPNDNETLLPWYGFSCWSEDAGSCRTAEYSVRSFSIQPGPGDKDDKSGTCWVFAEEGAAGRVRGVPRAVMGGIVGGFVAVWLAL